MEPLVNLDDLFEIYKHDYYDPIHKFEDFLKWRLISPGLTKYLEAIDIQRFRISLKDIKKVDLYLSINKKIKFSSSSYLLYKDGLPKIPYSNFSKLWVFTNDIKDSELSKFQNLTSLTVSGCKVAITDGGLTNLSNLTSLIIEGTNSITDNALKKMTGLRTLDLYHNPTISDYGISTLTSLEKLNLRLNSNITDEGLRPLINLKYIILTKNYRITGKGLRHLTNLEALYFREGITTDDLREFTNLRFLDLSRYVTEEIANELSDKAIDTLSSLEELDIGDCSCFSLGCLNSLPNLETLYYPEYRYDEPYITHLVEGANFYTEYIYDY